MKAHTLPNFIDCRALTQRGILKGCPFSESGSVSGTGGVGWQGDGGRSGVGRPFRQPDLPVALGAKTGTQRAVPGCASQIDSLTRIGSQVKQFFIIRLQAAHGSRQPAPVRRRRAPVMAAGALAARTPVNSLRDKGMNS
jgi:hypothetical protein